MSDELTTALADLRAKLTGSKKFADMSVAERVWHPRGGGWVTEASCPRCGSQVVYNGNYFCENWSYDCAWALPHPARSAADRRVCDVVGVDYY